MAFYPNIIILIGNTNVFANLTMFLTICHVIKNHLSLLFGY